MIELIKTLIPWIVLFGQVMFVVTLLILFYQNITKNKSAIILFIRKHALLFALIVASSAMLGSLFYSDIVGYSPCVLCWYQRIAMYPMVGLFALALWMHDKQFVYRYALLFSMIGIVIATYQYLSQVYVKLHPLDPLAPCTSDGISCAATFSWTFGYMTIPLMAVTGFALIILLMIIYKTGLKKIKTYHT